MNHDTLQNMIATEDKAGLAAAVEARSGEENAGLLLLMSRIARIHGLVNELLLLQNQGGFKK